MKLKYVNRQKMSGRDRKKMDSVLHFSVGRGIMIICRYSIAVITSVSQTEEAGSTPVICSRRRVAAASFAVQFF